MKLIQARHLLHIFTLALVVAVGGCQVALQQPPSQPAQVAAEKAQEAKASVEEAEAGLAGRSEEPDQTAIARTSARALALARTAHEAAISAQEAAAAHRNALDEGDPAQIEAAEKMLAQATEAAKAAEAHRQLVEKMIAPYTLDDIEVAQELSAAAMQQITAHTIVTARSAEKAAREALEAAQAYAAVVDELDDPTVAGLAKEGVAAAERAYQAAVAHLKQVSGFNDDLAAILEAEDKDFALGLSEADVAMTGLTAKHAAAAAEAAALVYLKVAGEANNPELVGPAEQAAATAAAMHKAAAAHLEQLRIYGKAADLEDEEVLAEEDEDLELGLTDAAMKAVSTAKVAKRAAAAAESAASAYAALANEADVPELVSAAEDSRGLAATLHEAATTHLEETQALLEVEDMGQETGVTQTNQALAKAQATANVAQRAAAMAEQAAAIHKAALDKLAATGDLNDPGMLDSAEEALTTAAALRKATATNPFILEELKGDEPDVQMLAADAVALAEVGRRAAAAAEAATAAHRAIVEQLDAIDALDDPSMLDTARQAHQAAIAAHKAAARLRTIYELEDLDELINQQ